MLYNIHNPCSWSCICKPFVLEEPKSPHGEEKNVTTDEKSSEMKTLPTRRAGQSYSPNIKHVLLKRLNTLDEGLENAAFEPEQSRDGDVTLTGKPTLSPAISLDKDNHGDRFKEVQYGTIDVWWLYDDGGKCWFRSESVAVRMSQTLDFSKRKRFIISPTNYVCVCVRGGGILFSRCPSVFPSVRP